MASDGTNGHTAPKWWSAQPAYTPTRKMRVVCVGAGFSGLMVAHKVQHELKLEEEIDLAIYERNPDIGGTWYENTYPGAACDVPAHTYVFPFEGNPDWSSFYVGQAEILAYMQRTAAKYNLCKHVQLETTIREAIWDEASAKWKIKLEHHGEVKEDEADFLINAAGWLNKWKWPDIPGLHDFKGKLLHTANWDNDYDYTGKKVAVIGNGSSGIQTVTAMQPVVAELVNYMRQPTWIAVNILADKTPGGVNFEYTEQQKRAFREDPTALWEYRRELENAINGAFFSMLLDHPMQALHEEQCKEHMASRMEAAPELAARLAPGYRPGCRRITPGDGYLEALQRPNCRDSWARITRATARGLVTTKTTTNPAADGDVEGEEQEEEEAFDAIVCATGFDSSWLPQWRMVGRGGATLETQWRDDPVAFFAAMVDGFPNYGMVNGPNPPISHGSVLTQMDWTVDFLLRWVMRMNREDIRTVAVKKEAVADFNEYAQAFLQGTVWAGPCRTLYKNGRTEGRITGVYAGSMGHFRAGLAAAVTGGEHFDLTWRSPNRFRCLGNGQTVADRNGAGDLAPYMARPPWGA